MESMFLLWTEASWDPSFPRRGNLGRDSYQRNRKHEDSRRDTHAQPQCSIGVTMYVSAPQARKCRVACTDKAKNDMNFGRSRMYWYVPTPSGH